MPISARRDDWLACASVPSLPRMQMPERSPFTSAAEDGHAAAEKLLGHDLQRHRLAGAGRARDQGRAGWTAPAAGFAPTCDPARRRQ
jgi:hypothetical protein